MSPIAGMIVGAIASLLTIFFAYVARKAYLWVVSFHTLILRGVRALEALQQELAYVRGLTGGQLGEMQVGGDPSESHVHAPGNIPVQRQPGPTIPFPSPYMDRFPQEPIPDATFDKADRELLEQTDADLVEMERIDRMRNSGMEVEDSNVVHPGITVEAP